MELHGRTWQSQSMEKKLSDALTQGVIQRDEYTDLGHQKVQ